MKEVIIYGVNQQAQALAAMIQQEKQARIAAFVVDSAYKKQDRLLGLPVYEAEKMKELFPPEQYQICLSFGYKNMVRNREEKFWRCKEQGYTIYTFISKNAYVYTSDIEEGCNIYPGTTIMPFVKIGKGCFIEAGCTIAHHTEIGAFNFIAPGAHFCGDVKSGRNCFFGGGCEVINCCELADFCFVAAGAKVNRDLSEKMAILPAPSFVAGVDAFSMMKKMF